MHGYWLLPSLDRPHLVKKFFESYKETEGSTAGMVLVDKQDPQKEEYLKLEYPKDWSLVLTEGRTMGNKVREVWDQVKDCAWVGILNDDHILKTKGWDQKILSQVNGTNIVFTNDGWVFPRRICGAICFSGKFLRTLGYMFLPEQQHLFSDDVWAYLAHKANCAQGLPDVLVEHDHAYKDKAKQDKTFTLINGEKGLVNGQGEGGFWPSDKGVYEKWLNSGRAEKDAQRVLDIQPKMGVMIATPSHDGNVAINYALGLADATLKLQQNNIYFEMARVVGSSLIPHARNSLVDMFLRSRCQRLLMIDADQGWDANALFHLLQSPRKIVAGVTPHKRYPINLNFEPLPEDAHFFKNLCHKGPEEFTNFVRAKADPKGDIEVNRVGTGFVMIDRSTFEIMNEHVKEYEPFDDKPDAKHKEYFQMGGFGGRFKGEDWFFCELAKKCSIPIFINANVVVSHQGTHNFSITAG